MKTQTTRADQGLTQIPMLRSRGIWRESEVPISVQVTDQADIGMHRHDFTEIVVVLAGVGDHLLDEDRFPISAGDVLAIDQNHVHGYRNARELRIANVLFNEQFVLDREQSLAHLAGYQALVHLEPGARRRLSFGGKLKLATGSRILIEQRVEELRRELQEKADGYQALALSILIDIIVHLCRLYGRSTSDTQRNLLDMGYVVGYLESHYSQRIEIRDLHPLVAMSARTLMRRFSHATGTTPMQYLLRVRVTRAAHLLRTTQASMTDISADVGFSDSNYFSRQFRRIIGVSPTDYRRSFAASLS